MFTVTIQLQSKLSFQPFILFTSRFCNCFIYLFQTFLYYFIAVSVLTWFKLIVVLTHDSSHIRQLLFWKVDYMCIIINSNSNIF